MEFGPIIKYYRLKSGITQAELADGICSIPHLSKIENNAYSVNKETAALLMERLGLDINDEVERYGVLEERLEEFIDALFYFELDKADELRLELEVDEEYYSKTNLVNLYHIYMGRYFFTKLDINSAQIHLQILERNRSNLSPIEELLFGYISGSTFYQKGKYREALDYYLKLKTNNISSNTSISMKEISYQIALCYSALGQSENSIPYAQEALYFYKEKDNFIRIIHTQMLQAINYESIKLYEEAKNNYNAILRNTKLLNLEDLYFKCLFNYSLLLSETNEHTKAIKYFKMCINYFKDQSEGQIIAIIELAKVLIKADIKNNELENYIEQLKKYKETENITKRTKLLIKEQILNYEKDSEKIYSFYEKELIPFIEKSKDEIYFRHYTLSLAKWYDSKNDITMAHRYYKLYSLY
ncbi:helix-turn-helix domain-containing protein [Alkalicoccobacillus murimartini]|uniref:Transcriptional regulator with XRE-family HTH domain n=1 Tax=Alkalicoccobacillus murimartini TaxID=171685 RepID=A0ABT9YIT8_9BACI|nr:helix-turn-helix transcriptional regulator [Alkalicoccobacillus murimartini]MDQ0207773.1 transcriptional regulator with XRE-family HTH domain [Alkalicoccobacillus murimartini]